MSASHRPSSTGPSSAGVPAGPVRVTVVARTDPGRTREHNEDTFLVADLGTGHADPHPIGVTSTVGPLGSLFVVADGMGGAAAGELASQMAADAIHQHLASHWPTEPDPTPERFAARIREAVELANARIHAYAQEHPDTRGMGTTVTAAGIFGHDLYLAQVGDSRGYLIRGGTAIQITRDQSLMQRLVEAGEITEEEAEASEHRNIILQALGPDPEVQVDLTWQRIRRGDVLILCSDGLSGLVRRQEMGEAVGSAPDLGACCDGLIALANSRGGPDNITVVAVRFDGDGLPEPEGADEVGYVAVDLPAPAQGAVPAPAEPEPAPTVPAPPAAEEAVAVARRRSTLSTVLYFLVAAALAILGYWLLGA